MKESVPSPRPRGRPRSASVRVAVHAAARRLLREKGYGGVTMEGLARTAGVGKPTLYRWWPTKAALYLELYREGAPGVFQVPDHGRLADDLDQLVRGVAAALSEPLQREAMAGMFAEAQLHPETFPEFQAGLLGMRRQVLLRILARAQARGELPGDLDPLLFGDLLFGPLIYRLLVRHAPLDDDFARRVVEQVLQQSRTRPPWRWVRRAPTP
jgi:AcrR family transcriptional regulator